MTIVKILIVFFMLGMIFFRLYLMKRRKGKKNKPYSFLAKQKEEQEKNDIFNLINKLRLSLITINLQDCMSMIQESSIFSPYHSKNFSIKDNNHTSGPPPNIIKNIYANTYPNTKPCIVICLIASKKSPVSFPNVI